MNFLSRGDRFRRYDLAFRVYMRYTAAFDRDRPSAYEQLLSELCNTQSCFRFFKDSLASYDPNLLGDVSQALYRLEGLLTELDKENLDPLSLEEEDLVRYRKQICVFTHLSFAYILMQVIYDPSTESQTSLIRLESFLLAFCEQWHNPVPITDLQSWLRTQENPPNSPEGNDPRHSVNMDAASDTNGEGSSRAFSMRVPNETETNGPEFVFELPGDIPVSTGSCVLAIRIPSHNSGSEPTMFLIPVQRVKVASNLTIDLTFLEDDGNSAIIQLCQSLVSGIHERLSRPTNPLNVNPRTGCHQLHRILQYFGTIGKRMVEFNFPRTTAMRPVRDLNKFVYWNTERWLCLVLWWITKAQDLNPAHDLPGLLQGRAGMVTWLDPASQHSNFQLCKAMFVLHALLGGRAIIQLLDDRCYNLFLDMEKLVWKTASQRSAQFTTFLNRVNTEQLNSGRSQAVGFGGHHDDGYPDGVLSIIDARQIGESASGDDNVLGQMNVLSTRMCTVELNVEPQHATWLHDGSTLAVLQVGYFTRSPRTPHFRLLSPLAEVIISEPFTGWKILRPVGHHMDSPLTYYAEVRDVYVNFALLSNEGRKEFETLCHDIQKGIYLPKKQERSWSITKAKHSHGGLESTHYMCCDGKITIEDRMLPGSTGGSRQRHILIEPSWGWSPHRVLHIPLNSLKVIAEESNGRIQIRWNHSRMQDKEFLFNPSYNGQIHHYHRDPMGRLLLDKGHEVHLPEVERGYASVTREHERCYAECKRETIRLPPISSGNPGAENLIYFSHDKVVISDQTSKQASWTCPYGRAQDKSNLYGYNSLDFRLSRPEAVTEFCEVILQLVPDALTLEERVELDSRGGDHEIRIFKSELYPENHRIVELYRKNKHTSEVNVSFVTPLANLQVAPGREWTDYSITNLLSHPFGCRIFDGDVGESWSYHGKPLSTYKVQPLKQLDIIGILRPHWQQVHPKSSGLGSFRQIKILQNDAGTSQPPVFKRGEGRIRFYKDISRPRNNLICWVDGEDGNSFVYWKVSEFRRGIKAGFRGLLNNWLVMDIFYETNTISDAFKTGTARLEFGQGSSIFEDFCIDAKHGNSTEGTVYTRGTLSSRSSVNEFTI